MRYLYLVRHGRVAYEGNVKRCIGRTEVDLDEIGRQQAKDLGAYFADKAIERIYCSPLKRTQETAALLANGREVIVHPGLIEMDMGEWENLPLKEIHKDLESEPQSGEKRNDAFKRFNQAIKDILKTTSGHIIIVSHSAMNCLYLSNILGVPLEKSRLLPQPFGCLNRIEINENQYKVLDVGIMPDTYPNEKKCYQIFSHFHTPEPVIAHCQKVTEVALSLAQQLIEKGYQLNQELVYSAALLHDVVRYKKRHDLEGYRALLREGYPQVAHVIRYHHQLDDDMVDRIDETTVVYLADKYVQGTQVVSIAKRFEKSLAKCQGNNEAMQAHQKKYQQALHVEKRILDAIGRSENNGIYTF